MKKAVLMQKQSSGQLWPWKEAGAPAYFPLPSLSSLPWWWRSSLGKSLAACALSLSALSEKLFAARRTEWSCHCVCSYLAWLNCVFWLFLFSLLLTVSSVKWSQPPRLSRHLLWTDPRRRHLPQPRPRPPCTSPLPRCLCPSWTRPARPSPGCPTQRLLLREPPAPKPLSVVWSRRQSALTWWAAFCFGEYLRESHLRAHSLLMKMLPIKKAVSDVPSLNFRSNCSWLERHVHCIFKPLAESIVRMFA